MRSVVFVIAVIGVTGSAASASAATIVPDDYYKLVGISDVAFSPDGTKLAAVEHHFDLAKDVRSSDLVLIDVATKDERSLTYGRESVASPEWSPSGDAIAFIARDAQKHSQVYLLPLGGGDPRPLTRAKAGVQQFAWRPDGSAIAYITADPDPQKAAVEAHHDFFDITNEDDLERSNDPNSHVRLVARDGSNDRVIATGPWSTATAYPPAPPASPLSWSPDGRSLLFTRVPNTRDGDAYRSQIVRLDVATGHVVPVTGHTKFEGFAQYSPDGSKIAYLYSRDGDPNNENDVYVTDGSGEGTDVSRVLDRAIYRAQWFPDGKSLLVGSHDGTRTLLWRLALDGTFTKIDTGEENPSWSFWIDDTIARDGTIAYPGADSAHPTELYASSAAGGEPVRLTDLNEAVASRDAGRVEEVTWDNDGFHEDGILVYPPHDVAGKRYPLVLNVHGGPQAASGTSYDILGQILAARGWLVFEPNYRGSDNSGNAYERAISMDAGAGPGRDVMAGVAALEKRGIVDESRIAVGGWSYGGFMTSWLMTHYHVWRTAISGAAVNDWLDMYDLGDGNVQTAFAFKGSPWVGDNMRDYRAQSPITYAAQTRCPVLVISDVGDVRVPITQSFEMYHALADNHIPVRFVGIPVDGHFPGDPIRTHDVFALWTSWMADHLK